MTPPDSDTTPDMPPDAPPPEPIPAEAQDADVHVREMWDRMTRAYLRGVVTEALIEEHRRHPDGHPSEPLARLLAWCARRPVAERYAVKAEADGTFRLVTMAGRRGQPPAYAGEERFQTLREARHGVLLRHIHDLTGR